MLLKNPQYIITVALTSAFGSRAQAICSGLGVRIVSRLYTAIGSSDEKQKTVLPFAVSTIGFNLSGDGLLKV